MNVLLFVKISDKATTPTKGSEQAAGYDLYSATSVTVESHNRALISTDIKVQVPIGTYGRIAPRSGLSVNYFIDIGAGVVDRDYRGTLKVLLYNHSDKDFVVKQGDCIAQLICEKIIEPEILQVASLSYTKRGEGGFGSTSCSRYV